MTSRRKVEDSFAFTNSFKSLILFCKFITKSTISLSAEEVGGRETNFSIFSMLSMTNNSSLIKYSISLNSSNFPAFIGILFVVKVAFFKMVIESMMDFIPNVRI